MAITSRSSRFKLFAVDTVVGLSFNLVVGAAIDKCIAGLTWEQCAEARGISSLMTLVLGGAYGCYRDWFVGVCGVNEQSSRMIRVVTDVGAFSSFNSPLAAGILVAVGADASQIVRTVVTVNVISPVLGRPYGMYLQWARKKCGVSGYNDREERR
ncbi:MAG: L-alanine exporter AlaE [Nanoarchaeota archaeon]|nr:L-alanine exporter AlaE [Nanoarchaeota archaeon]